MGITSYAQNFEDVLLWRALGHVEKGCYIDVGAQHPVIDSVSKAFYDAGWRGISVEPCASYADLLRKERPGDVVLMSAVTDSAGVLTLFEVTGTGLSTTSPEIAARHRAAGLPVVEATVACVTLDEVLALRRSRTVHWLKIDVEGAEKRVMEGWRNKQRPWVVVVESTAPNTQDETHEEWEPALLAKGYAFAHEDGLNRYYVHESHGELAAALRFGPNCWDDFRLTPHFWATHHIAEGYEQRLAEQAELDGRVRLELQDRVDAASGMEQELQLLRASHSRSVEEGMLRERALLDALQQSAGRESASAARHAQAIAAQERALLLQTEALREESQARLAREHRKAAAREEELLAQLAAAAEALRAEERRAKHESAQQRAESETAQTRLRAESEATQARLRAESEAAQARLLAESQALQARLLAESDAAQERLLADAEASRARLRADAEVVQAQLRAELEALGGRLQQAEESARTKTEEIASLAARVAELHAALVGSNTQVAALEARDAARRTELEAAHGERLRLISLVEASASRESALVTQVESLNQQLRDASASAARFATGLSSMREAAANARLQNEALAAEIQGMRSSQPWRLGTALVAYRPPPSFPMSPVSPPPDDRPIAMSSIHHVNQLLDFDGEAFVFAVYERVLGREPDPTGFSYYMDRLRRGFSRESVIAQVASSAEARARIIALPGLDALIARDRWERSWLGAFLTRGRRLEQRIGQIDYRLGALGRGGARPLSPEVQALTQDIAAAAPPTHAQPAGGESVPDEAASVPEAARDIFNRMAAARPRGNT
jgi:FkbM family methyltransferase